MSNTSGDTQIIKKLLADTFAIYLKTLNYHWNIRKTEHFYSLHKLLEAQYEQLAEDMDEIAEVIATMGEYAPGTFAELQSLTSIADGDATKDDLAMLEELAKDHDSIVELARQVGENADYLTVDLLVQRGRAHSKMGWMLRASSKNVKHCS